MQTTPEVERADRAAELAAMHLAEARERHVEVSAQAKEITRLTRENGFAELIRNAFGS